MINNPLVSIVVTTFNRKQILKETIDSILNQTFENFELIVIDNFSDYDFIAYMDAFNDIRIKPFQNNNNGIIALNRNFGLGKSIGKYIAFCDDDDIWFPRKLEKQINILKDSSDKVVFCMQKHFGETNIFSEHFGIGPFPFRQKTDTKSLIRVNCIPFSTVLLKKDIFDKVKYFSEEKIFIGIEDHEMWIRMSKVSNFNFIPEVLVLHRVHKNNAFSKISSIDKGIKKLNQIYSNEIQARIVRKKRNVISLFLRNFFNLIWCKLFISMSDFSKNYK